jgi:hypothetical protein
MATNELKPEVKPLRYTCIICDMLFDTHVACADHIQQAHMKLIFQTYVRPTYREK